MCGFATIPRFSFFIPRTLFCHSVQSVSSCRAYFFVIPSTSEESSAWMLHFAQHDKTSRAQHSFFHSAHSVSSFRAYFFVIPSILFLSFRASARNPAHGCFTSFSMTRPVMPSTLFFIPRTLFCHSVQSVSSCRALFFVIPSILFLSFRTQ